MKESSRQERIIRTSLIGILVNLLIAAVKIVIGTLASSIAIVSEGINNATDAGSSFLTYVGTKLSGKHPDEKHPFGYGRIEYLTGMVVGILILYAGISMLKESNRWNFTSIGYEGQYVDGSDRGGNSCDEVLPWNVYNKDRKISGIGSTSGSGRRRKE